MPATARPLLRNSQNHPAHSRSAFVQLHRPRRVPAGSNKTRGCADENCGPNRTNAPCESHAIRPRPRIDRHRRRAGAIHLSPHAKHPPRPRILKSFHLITSVTAKIATSVSSPRGLLGPTLPAWQRRHKWFARIPESHHRGIPRDARRRKAERIRVTADETKPPPALLSLGRNHQARDRRRNRRAPWKFVRCPARNRDCSPPVNRLRA